MMWSLAALVIGFCIDLLVGDPHSFPHPVVLIGKCISVLERVLRCICPKTPAGERAAGRGGHRIHRRPGSAAVAVRSGQPVAASGAGECDVLADLGGQVPAGRDHEGL